MNNKLKIILSLVLLIAVVVSVKLLLPDQQANSDGHITFILVNETGEEVINEEIPYYKGDTLYDVLQRKYDVLCANIEYEKDDTCSYDSEYGKALLQIEDVETDWYNSFLALYINDEYANYGVSKLPFKDGDIIRFVWTPLS